MDREKHKKIAADLYRRLDIAVKALESATSEQKEAKAEARINLLEEKITALGEGKPKGKAKPKTDYTCEECGGDLFEVEKGVFYCEECSLYYEEEEAEEEEEED